MAVEKGFIEYEFTQTGSEQVVRQMQRIQSETDDLTKSFIDYEKEVRGVSNTERDMARETANLAKVAKKASESQDSLEKSTRRTRDEMIAGRYAAYDLARTYAVIGTALSGIGIYSTKVGAQFESAFTNVERTLNPLEAAAVGIDNVRESLINMTGEIPLAFEEITKIATLGNQLGIAAEDLVGFTETVAQFAAVTGISVEETALAFGQLGNLLGVSAEYYENMASAIALVGVNSEATEEQIISIAREIAPAARAAGLAADEVIGLSGALGSIRVPPERSRSTILQFFETLNMAAARGGTDFENFAVVVGTTVDQLDAMVRAGRGSDILRQFLGTLSTSDTIEITRALDALGLAGLRVNPTMRALSDNLDKLDSAMSDAREGFIGGAELNRQYAKTLDDLNSQWVIFINGLNAIIATISGGAVESLSGLLMGVNRLIFGFRQWLVDNPFAARILALGGAMITVIGIMALLRGASFALRGSMLAYLFVAQQTNIANTTLVGTLRAVAAAMNTTTGATARATTAMRIFRAVLSATGIGLLITSLGWLGDQLMGLGGAADSAKIDYDRFLESSRRGQGAVDGAADGAGNLADRLGGAGGVADSAKEAAAQIRLLTDYAQELSGVFSRSIELRFSSQTAMDDITLKWIELNEEVEEYRRTIRSLTADRELRAYWLSIAEAYGDQLRAGQLREELAKVDDDLAKANAGASRELEGQSRSAIENRKVMTGLVDQYEEYITALVRSGASQQFVQEEIQRLNSEFMDQATALGYSAAELQKYERSFGDFAKIISQMPADISIGFDLDPAQQALNEFFAKAQADAAAAGAGMGDAMGSGFGGGLDDYLFDYEPDFDYSDQMRLAGANSGRNWGMAVWSQFLDVFNPEAVTNEAVLTGARWGGGLRGGIDQSKWYTGIFAGGYANTLNAEAASAGYLAGVTFSDRFGNAVRNNLGGAVGGALSALRVTISGGGLPGYATGGYTGAGHWLQPKGIVHGGEYVIPKYGVDQRTKLPKMDYVASLARGQKASRGVGFSGGGYASGVAQPVRVVNSVDLGARTMSGMSALGGGDVRIGDRMVAEAASRGSRSESMIGAA